MRILISIAIVSSAAVNWDEPHQEKGLFQGFFDSFGTTSSQPIHRVAAQPNVLPIAEQHSQNTFAKLDELPPVSDPQIVFVEPRPQPIIDARPPPAIDAKPPPTIDARPQSSDPFGIVDGSSVASPDKSPAKSGLDEPSKETVTKDPHKEKIEIKEKVEPANNQGQKGIDEEVPKSKEPKSNDKEEIKERIKKNLPKEEKDASACFKPLPTSIILVFILSLLM